MRWRAFESILKPFVLALLIVLLIAQPGLGEFNPNSGQQLLAVSSSNSLPSVRQQVNGRSSPAAQPSQAKVSPPTLTSERTGIAGRGRLGPFFTLGAPMHLLSLLLSAVAGFGFLRWRSSFLVQLAEISSGRPAQVAAWGLLGTTIILTLSLLALLIALSGPLLFIIDGVFFLGILLGRLGVYLWVGQQFDQKLAYKRAPIMEQQLQQLLVGLALVGGLGLLPGLGELLMLVINFWGLGTILAWQVEQGHSQTPAPGS